MHGPAVATETPVTLMRDTYVTVRETPQTNSHMCMSRFRGLTIQRTNHTRMPSHWHPSWSAQSSVNSWRSANATAT